MLPSQTAADALDITLFGPMSIRVQGRLLPPVRTRKALWLLVLLILRHDRPVQREWLAGTLWPDTDPSHAFANMRQVLNKLRKALGDQATRLQSPDRHTLLFDLTGMGVDVLQFDRAIQSGKLSDLERAAALYRGPLLEGCMEEWVFQERASREQDCLQALQKIGNAALAEEDYEKALLSYRRAIGIDPWWEAAQRGCMETLARSGDTNAALQVYREFVEVLRSDPSAVPDEQTSALYQRLRSEARRRASAPKGITAKEAVVPAVPAITGHLPHPLTDLIGREDERLDVIACLRRSRVVTLTGLGGIGKTRLAIEIAAGSVREHADGVWMVALEALSEEAQVVQQIASVLGVQERSAQKLLHTLTEHLRKKRLLLVLDNCEHLLAASARIVASLLRECAEVHILATSREALGIMGETVWAVPALTIPAPAHLPQTRATLLRVLMGYESVQLFVERAQAIQKTFTLNRANAEAIARICTQLEGIPLAIELAAVRVKAMTVEQIAERLHDHLNLLTGGNRTAISRQQTLRATLDGSYVLLSEAERVLLHRLSVFSGGCDLKAAEIVCTGGEVQELEVLDLLSALVDKSLVVFDAREQSGAGRYRLLEVVRQYAAEKLQERESARERETKHRDWCVALSEIAGSKLVGAEQKVWLEHLVTEYDNLRLALARCGNDPQGSEAGLRLVGALWQFWHIRHAAWEGRRYTEEALARDGAQAPTRYRAKALNALGLTLERQGEYPAARECHEEALRIREQIGDRRGIGDSYFALGNIANVLRDPDSGRKFHEQSLAIRRELGDRRGVAMVLTNFGVQALRGLYFSEAKSLYEESLALFRDLGDAAMVAFTLYNLAIAAQATGDFRWAESSLEESLTIAEELCDRHRQAWIHYTFASIAQEQRHFDLAKARCETALSLFRELGDKLGIAWICRFLGEIAIYQGDLKAAQTWLVEGSVLFEELGEKTGIAFSLQGMALLAYHRGDVANAYRSLDASLRDLHALGATRGVIAVLEERAGWMLGSAETEGAVRLLGATHRMRANLGTPAPPQHQIQLDTHLDRARAVLDSAAFRARWEEGYAMHWDQAVKAAVSGTTPEGTT